MNNNNPRHTDQEIDLLDLFWYLLSKWKPMLIVGIVFLVLLAGYKTVSVLNDTDEKKVQALVDSRTSDYDEMNLIVNDARLTQVKSLYNNIERINYNKEYMLVSEKYNTDAKNKNVVDLHYSILSGYVANYTSDISRDYTNQLTDAYVSLLSSEELFGLCADALDIDERYVGELIGVGVKASDMFYVSVFASTPERAEILADTIDGYLKDVVDDLNKEIGDHKLNLVSKNAKTVVDDALYNWQLSQLDSIYYYANTVNSTLSTFTMGQVLTFEKMLYDEYPDGIEGVITRPTNIVEYNPETGAKNTIVAKYELTEKYIDHEGIELAYVSGEVKEKEDTSLVVAAAKFGIIGFILGAFIVCAWFGVKYIFNGLVKSSRELAEGYGISVLGDASHTKEKNTTFADKLRYKKAISFAEGKDLCFVNTKVVAKRIEGKQLLVSTLELKDDMLDIAKELVAELKNSGVDIELADNLNYSVDSIEKLSAAKSVVFIEQGGKLKYKELDEALAKCDRQAVDVSGVIML